MPRKKKQKNNSAQRRAASTQGRGVSRTQPSQRSGRGPAYMVNKRFSLFSELQALVLKAAPPEAPQIKKDLRRIGKIKLALMSGVFLGVDEARVDLLVVGENIKLARLFEFIKEKETELGRELRYVILSPDEFAYRYDMFDRFLKDILETPHQKIINTIRVS